MEIAYKRKNISGFVSRLHGGVAAMLLIIIFLSGCGKGFDLKNGGAPPGAASGFTAASDDGRIVLTWSKPGDPGFRGVLIRRGTLDYPQVPAGPNIASDKIIFAGSGTSFTDFEAAIGAKYFYSAFAYGDNTSFSAAAFASATCTILPFAIIALPDTQHLSDGYPDLFKTQTQWIVDNNATRRIAFALHEGDITHTNTVKEWNNASAAMAILDGVVPYAIVPGNHDTGSGRNTTKMNEYFPVSRFSGRPGFGGVYEPDKIDNSYHFFYAGGTNWLIVALEYNPRDEALAWAGQIVAAHPDRRVIVLTHAYLDENNQRESIGENIWNKFVKKHKNISFVFNGHIITDKFASRLVSVGDNGNNVYQMMADYQTLTFGGTGYLRIVVFDPIQNKVSVKTYTPWRDEYMADSDNQFVFDNVDLGPPAP